MSGFECLLRGFRLIFSSGLKRYVIVPFLINLVLFVGMVYYAVNLFDGWISSIIGYLPEFLYFLSWFLWLMFFVALLGFMFYAFTIAANIIAAPFNAVLAVEVEKRERGESYQPADIPWYALVPRTLAREASKLMYYLPRLVGLILLTLVPMINLLAPVLWVLFGAWMMTVQYADYAADNNGWTFQALRMSMSRDRTHSLSFGIMVYLMMAIPLINLLVLPAAVAGGTVFWTKRLYQDAEH